MAPMARALRMSLHSRSPTTGCSPTATRRRWSTRDGSIDWLCLPRYDSAAVFARILDPDAGHWSIRPTGVHDRAPLPPRHARRRDDVHDRHRARSGCTDAMAFADGPARARARLRRSPRAAARRRGRVRRGRAELELAPRPEYGLVRPLIRLEDGGARTFGAGPHRRARRGSPLEVDGRDDARRVHGRRGRARRVRAALGAGRGAGGPAEPTPAAEVAERIDDTAEAWRSWEAEHDIYDGPHRELVRLSSRVLKGLTYRPTGAIVAAPTTSLPETVGGERNWDYRYSWIRDSSLTIEALYIGACSDEAEEFVSFMTSSAGGRAGEGSLQIMYGIGGEHDLSERELAAPARLARLDPRARRQRRLGPGPARRLRRAAQLAVALPGAARRPASGDPGVRGRPRRHRGAALDARPTPACGRCAASRATTSPRRCCAGPRSTARSSSRRSSGSTPRSTSGRPPATRSAPRFSSAAGARSARPSPSRSTRTSSTPRSS